MKTNFLKAVTVCIGAAFALSTVAARADEPNVSTAPRKHAAAKTSPTEITTFTTVIPTRDGKSAKYVSGGIVGGADGHENAVLTGSQLPRSYNRRAYTTDANGSAFIYDQNDIRLQSTLTVQDSLRSVPGVNVGGSR